MSDCVCDTPQLKEVQQEAAEWKRIADDLTRQLVASKGDVASCRAIVKLMSGEIERLTTENNALRNLATGASA